MATFIYFIPSEVKGASKNESIEKFGLRYALNGPIEMTPLLGEGPGGERGTIIRIQGKSSDGKGGELSLGYFKDRQTWRKVAKSEAWVGYWNDHKPTPSDLEKDKIVLGHAITFRDGNAWTVPMATIFYESENAPGRAISLPTISDVDANGNWIDNEVEPSCARLLEIAERIWPKVFENAAEGGLLPEFGDERDAAIEVFQHNYRIGATEFGMLKLCTREEMHGILLALVDWPTALEWIKKKAEGTPSAT